MKGSVYGLIYSNGKGRYLTQSQKSPGSSRAITKMKATKQTPSISPTTQRSVPTYARLVGVIKVNQLGVIYRFYRTHLPTHHDSCVIKNKNRYNNLCPDAFISLSISVLSKLPAGTAVV